MTSGRWEMEALLRRSAPTVRAAAGRLALRACAAAWRVATIS
ncbi:MAG TPA: hypothetical protein VF832_18605 [Longimicrobiales bacterium]